MRDLKSMCALITGATSGIGQATARKLAKEGCGKLILAARRTERLTTLKTELEQLGAEVCTITLDVRDKSAVDQAFGQLPKGFERVDVLLNNAGLASGLDTFDNADMNDIEVMIDTNVKGLIYVSKAIIPHMIKQGAGHIINVASIAGKEVYGNGNVYCATKHAVDALTRGMRVDLVSKGIKVSQIAPGAVNTEFSTVRFHGDTERADHVYDGYQPLTGEDIAECLFFMISAPEHLNVADMLILPLAQGDSRTFIRK
ncbi:NADP-dependent 3-hydroxy acid dehydrogenase YdfG [Porphyromonas cangingivalis]|uniref:SDR family NAD(P)-dependent oxidoreductase n=1 Tax=Porphyromonas cangingivalis TaxID=36874 RepID=UPI000D86F2C8|nr:SDR family NAD(P)-dependent oxidoreductase [Porphyromonas cangingivalis]SPY34407.1 NADP-dependent 3-hydroxy acid dehydrogenase YdfG [Porphyromonas cangingivalis]